MWRLENSEIMKTIKDTSNQVSILQSSNMSLGVNLLLQLVRKTSSTLDDINYDIDTSNIMWETPLSVMKEYSKGRQRRSSTIPPRRRSKNNFITKNFNKDNIMKKTFTFIAALFLFTSFIFTAGCFDSSNDNADCQCEECVCEDECSCGDECTCPNCAP